MGKVSKALVKVAKLIAMEFDTKDALDKYLKEHPDADRSNHTVKQQKPDRNTVIKNIYESKNPGTKDVVSLINRVWDIEKIDWNKAKKELSNLPSGQKFIKQIESLPKFDEISKGNYSKVQTPELIKDWEDFAKKVLPQIENEFIEFHKNKTAKLVKVAKSLIAVYGDPYWLTVKYPTRCHKCHAPINKGEQAFYYPRTKTMYGEKCGHGGEAYHDFQNKIEEERYF